MITFSHWSNWPLVRSPFALGRPIRPLFAPALWAMRRYGLRSVANCPRSTPMDKMLLNDVHSLRGGIISKLEQGE